MARTHNLTTFGNRLSELNNAISEALLASHREVVVFAATAAAAETPIDVGTARSNWVARNGSPSAVIRRAYNPYPSRWRGAGGSGGAFGEVANVQGVAAQARAAVARRRAGTDTYISNALPYIKRLDSGYSPQAAAGIARRAVLETVNQVGRIYANNLRRALR